MVWQNGKWALWTRGQKPTALTQWEDFSQHMGNPTFEELLPAFLLLKSQGQHVKLEWIPENAYGQGSPGNSDQNSPYQAHREDREHNPYSDRVWLGETVDQVPGMGYV